MYRGWATSRNAVRVENSATDTTGQKGLEKESSQGIQSFVGPTRGYSPFVKQLSILLDNTSPCYLPLHSVSLQSSSFPPSLILLLRFFVSFFDNLRLILVGIP